MVTDRFVRVVDDAPLPDRPDPADGRALPGRRGRIGLAPGPVGVIWPNSRKVSDLAPHLHRLSLVALAFPKFQDGRAYSQARQLREQYGFNGELRATGDVLRDQRLFLLRAGFDAFEVKKDADVNHSSSRACVTACFISRPAMRAFRRCASDRPSLGPARSYPPTIPIMAHF